MSNEKKSFLVSLRERLAACFRSVRRVFSKKPRAQDSAVEDMLNEPEALKRGREWDAKRMQA